MPRSTLPITVIKPLRDFREPMLCPTGKLTDKMLTQGAVKFPRMLSPKIDGIRAVWHGQNLLSRAMKCIPNLHTASVIADIAKTYPEIKGFDGELIVGPENTTGLMQRTSSGIMSVQGEPDFRWRIFDKYHEPGDFRTSSSRRTFIYHERLSAAERLCERINDPRLSIVAHVDCNSVGYLMEYEEWALENGYEGVILNDPIAIYRCGRSTWKTQELLRRKPFEDFEAVIVDVYEQKKNTNAAVTDERGRSKRSSHRSGKLPAGTLGGFTCRLPSGVEFNVGGGPGLTAERRLELWNTRDEHIGKIAKLRKQSHGEKDKPRMPGFLGFRDARDLSPRAGTSETLFDA